MLNPAHIVDFNYFSIFNFQLISILDAAIKDDMKKQNFIIFSFLNAQFCSLRQRMMDPCETFHGLI